MGYKKIKPVKHGYHDQCIFLCNKNVVNTNFNNILNKNNDEINFLDIIDYLPNVNYFETNYEIKSFNDTKDLNKIF